MPDTYSLAPLEWSDSKWPLISACEALFIRGFKMCLGRSGKKWTLALVPIMRLGGVQLLRLCYWLHHFS